MTATQVTDGMLAATPYPNYNELVQTLQINLQGGYTFDEWMKDLGLLRV